MDQIAASNTRAGPFGPWVPGIDPVERKMQFRSLASLAAAFFGANHPLVRELRCAETDNEAAARALAMLDSTPTLIKRKMLSVFGAITWPRRAPR
jgi:hypothetical protein